MVLAACAAAWLPPAGAQPGGAPSAVEEVRRRLERGDSTANPFTPGGSAPTEPAGQVLLGPDRPVRVPGTAFALGDSVESLVQRLGLAPQGEEAAATRTFAGTVRFFGQDARARLVFIERQLARVELETGPVSARTRGFIADELTRQGYRRACRSWTLEASDCTWRGRTQIELRMDSTRVSARVGLPAAAIPPPAPSSGSVMSGAGWETLPAAEVWRNATTTVDPTGPMVVERAAPAYPQLAREAGVDGTVVVRGLIDPSGRVVDAVIVKSVPMLDAAALECVRGWRFRPTPLYFAVEVPVKFTLH